MALTLRVLAGPPGAASSPVVPAAERTVALDDHLGEIRFGRRAGLEVELPFAALAPIHARMVRRASGWVVEDLAGTGDTIVDEVALDPGHLRPVAPGSVIRLAHIAIVFEGSGSAPRAGESTATIARRLVSDLFGAGGGGGQVPSLTAISGWAPDQASPPALRLAVPDRPYLVGRGEDCDLVLPLEEISREHAVLVRRWEGIHIRDLGSKNGVRVAGTLVTAETRLRDGDQIEIGPVEFRLDDPEDRYLREIEAQDQAPAVDVAPSEASLPIAAEVTDRPRATASPRTAQVAIVVASIVLLAIAAVVVVLVLILG